jgi:hypothetical protein
MEFILRTQRAQGMSLSPKLTATYVDGFLSAKYALPGIAGKRFMAIAEVALGISILNHLSTANHHKQEM